MMNASFALDSVSEIPSLRGLGETPKHARRYRRCARNSLVDPLNRLFPIMCLETARLTLQTVSTFRVLGLAASFRLIGGSARGRSMRRTPNREGS